VRSFLCFDPCGEVDENYKIVILQFTDMFCVEFLLVRVSFTLNPSPLYVQRTIMYVECIDIELEKNLCTITVQLLYNFLLSSKGSKCNILKCVRRGIESW
jgi:hypothetical protein